jgi:hypothetical protein
MRCSYYPQSLAQIRGAIREIGSWIWGVDSQTLFIPSCLGMSDLTGALDRSDRCESLVGFVSGNYRFHVVLFRGPAGQFLACLELFC